jgi:hypothetical protein
MYQFCKIEKIACCYCGKDDYDHKLKCRIGITRKVAGASIHVNEIDKLKECPLESRKVKGKKK